ncbi:MAG: hypothetical protein LBK73_01440 [Treponema sp.]|jgi:hypothetical protein|nr:hypothetical protein [Treponema sp.]
MKNFLWGLLLLSLVGCASMEERKRLELEAEQVELGDNWWHNKREFNSIEEAKGFVDMWFVKIEQITRLRPSKGLNGVLKPVRSNILYTPPDNKIEINWDISVSSSEDHWLDLSKEPLESCHKAMLFVTVWHQGKGVILSWYGVKDGWYFSNNMQLYQWNDNTICEYPVGLTKAKAWSHLEYKNSYNSSPQQGGVQETSARQAQYNEEQMAADRKYAWDNGYIYAVHIEKPVLQSHTNSIWGDMSSTNRLLYEVGKDWQGKAHGLWCSYFLYWINNDYMHRGSVYYFDDAKWAADCLREQLEGDPELKGFVYIRKLVSEDLEIDIEI